MKFIHCADFHLGIKKYGKVNISSGMNTRVVEDLSQLDKIIDYGISKKIDLFLIAGDVFDKRKPDEIVQKEFAKRLKKLIDNKIITIVLIGNHEGVTAKDTAHCLSSINEINSSNYLNIVDKNKFIVNNKLKINILCMPYYSEVNIKNVTASNNYPIIVIGHFGIKGARQGGHMFDGGVDPNIFNNSEQVKYVALGHIHQHQVIGRAVYSGGINRINFGDEGIKKGFIYGNYNEETRKCKWKFIQLKSRRFLTIDTAWGNRAKRLIKQYEVENKIVKINIVDKSGSAIIPVFEIKKYLDKNKAIIDSVNVVRNIEFHVRDRGYIQSKTPKQMLKRYLKGERKSVIKRGIRLLSEVAK